MWMNESEIDHAVFVTRQHKPEYYPYAKYLSDWRDIVNQNSDGWPYWTAASKAANKLMTLLDSVTKGRGNPHPAPTDEDFKRTLTPIKSLATRRKLPAPTLSEGGLRGQ